jgi:uncharacterized damage-inducible protein DinB
MMVIEDSAAPEAHGPYAVTRMLSEGYRSLPRAADERTTLQSFLEWQRDTLARKCDGLTTEQLRVRAAPPSTLSLLGLLRHLADVERGWFQRTLDGQDLPDLYSTDADPDGDFDNVDYADAAEAMATWRRECERSRAVIANHALDDIVHQKTGTAVSMRWIMTHMVEEYSRHNGHADLLRQRIDGATGY